MNISTSYYTGRHEPFLNRRRYTKDDDIFCLGLVFLCILYGEIPKFNFLNTYRGTWKKLNEAQVKIIIEQGCLKLYPSVQGSFCIK